MGWTSKFTTSRRMEKKKKRKSETGPNHNDQRCCYREYGQNHLKSCLKKKTTGAVTAAAAAAADCQCSFSSAFASAASTSAGGGHNIIDPRSSIHINNESLQTRSTDYSSSSSSSSRPSSRLYKKNVRFHEIQIRTYQRTVGDNPSVSAGPPVG
jgi:hypothetical protein